MDPNKTLDRIRTLRAWLDSVTEPNAQTLREYADELTELVEALDEWLSAGGFLPAEWRR